MKYSDEEKALYGAIQSKDYLTPCAASPDYWGERKIVASGTREKQTAYLNRVREARRRCHECEVFVECSLLAATINPKDPAIVGILAGQLFAHSFNGNSTTVKKITNILRREEAAK